MDTDTIAPPATDDDTTGHDSDRRMSMTDALVAAARQYARWGWQTTLSGSEVLLSTGSRISGVELPVDLAGAVQHFLGVSMLAGPVIALPGLPRRWVLLTESADTTPAVVIDRLAPHQVIVHRGGERVPLPPSITGDGPVTWQHQPVHGNGTVFVPPFATVAAAVRSVTYLPGLS